MQKTAANGATSRALRTNSQFQKQFQLQERKHFRAAGGESNGRDGIRLLERHSVVKIFSQVLELAGTEECACIGEPSFDATESLGGQSFSAADLHRHGIEKNSVVQESVCD